MFGGIAGGYDRLNRILSLGLDARWRGVAVQALGVVSGGHYLDLGTGTADLVVEALRQVPGARLTGVDAALPMLLVGQAKLAARGLGARATLLAADGLRLPFCPSCFDGVCSAFVIRNVVDRARLLGELHRVLRPGARASLLELTRPAHRVLRLGHGLCLRVFVPVIGRALSSGAAYAYLAESIRRFPEPEAVLAEMGEAGFRELSARPLSGGVVTLMVGRRAG